MAVYMIYEMAIFIKRRLFYHKRNITRTTGIIKGGSFRVNNLKLLKRISMSIATNI